MPNSKSQAGTDAQQITEGEVTMSSSHNAKPHVVRSPKSEDEPVSKLVDLPKFNGNEFNKRMRSYDDLFKMWGLDNS